MTHCPATRLLLDLYRDPSRAPALSGADWAEVLAATRRSRTLGHLGLALELARPVPAIGAPVAAHLESVQVLIRHRRRLLRREMTELGRATAPADTPVVLLKGAAYEALGLPLAQARLPADIDLLVARSRLAAVEDALRSAGWIAAEMNDYDERYYREWSHELPPFAHPARGIECDLHHSITPALRGPGVETQALIDASIEIGWDGHRRFRVLQPVDQLIHCALHTFKDSDLGLRLRESMDFDLLYRHYAALDPALPRTLARRANELGQVRPLWWAVHFARRWLASPVPAELLAMLPAPAPGTVRAMDWLCDRAMLPGPRLERAGLDRLAALLLLSRYQYQRLPLAKLVPHVLEKSRRRLLPAREAAEVR